MTNNIPKTLLINQGEYKPVRRRVIISLTHEILGEPIVFVVHKQKGGIYCLTEYGTGYRMGTATTKGVSLDTLGEWAKRFLGAISSSGQQRILDFIKTATKLNG